MQVISGEGSNARKYWTRWLTILLCYTVFAMVVFILIYLDGPGALYENYGAQNWRVMDITINIVKCTIIYYFLIFYIFLPVVRSGELQFILFKLLQLLLFFILLTAFECYLVFEIKNPVAERQGLTFRDYMFWELGIDITITVICLLIAIVIEMRQKAARQRELEKGKLMAELSAIKYQINPHFLFNCLNFIYTKSIVSNKEVAHTVALLSEIMRYALEQKEDQEGLVPLVEEIDHMKNVIEINQMRFADNLKIRFFEEIDDHATRIPPLVLITLVENAFKHGDLTDDNHPLNIKLEVIRGKLWFYIQNKKKRGVKELSSGIGLPNVKQRLQLMYGVKHSFQTKEDEQFYVAELTINL